MTFIYRATNKENGKIYVGRTSYDRLSKRINTHWWYAKHTDSNLPFPNALRKYGRDGFEWDVLEECSREDAGTREMFWIQELQPQYNATLGGDGGTSGRPCPDNVREATRKANSKPVLCVDTGEVFSSATEAGLSLGKPSGYSNISRALRGKTNKAYGLSWRYYDKYIKESISNDTTD